MRSLLALLSVILLPLIANASAPSVEERFAPRQIVTGGQPIRVDFTRDHLALRVVPSTSTDALALLVEEQLSKLTAGSDLWPRLIEVIRARPHGLYVVRFDDELPTPLLVELAQRLAAVDGIAHVLPGLRRRSGRAFYDERLILTAEAGRLDEILATALPLVGGRVIRRSLVPDTALVEVGAPVGSDAVEAGRVLTKLPGIVSAEPDLYREYALTSLTLDDPLLPAQWHLGRVDEGIVPGTGEIHARQAWEFTTGNAGVVVAVFDSGTDLEHEDLRENIVGGFDAVSNDDVPQAGCSSSFDGDDYAPSCPASTPFRESHGTSVSGTIAARGGNGLGVTGVCPACSLYPVRLLGGEYGASLTVAETFIRSVDAGADIINNSWGPGASIYFPLSQAERDAFEYARSRGRGGLGTVIVFAAGNETSDVGLDAYAATPLTLAVSASTNLDDFALYSNYGELIDVAAPSAGGTVDADNFGILTTDVTGSEGYAQNEYNPSFGGTSAASPIVAGVAGLLLSRNPSLTAEQVRLLLTSTADKIVADKVDWPAVIGSDLATIFDYDEFGHSLGFGYGRVNAGAAVASADTPSVLGALCTSPGCEFCDATTNRCLTSCEVQNDCPDGSRCRDGRCRLPATPRTAIGAPCSASCEACVPALDTYFGETEVCTATCSDDDSCPAGFDCRRLAEEEERLCVPGATGAGEPASVFNCVNPLLGVSVVVENGNDSYCSDVCLGEQDTCPFGFHCGYAACECTRETQWGCFAFACQEVASSSAANFYAPICHPEVAFGEECTADLDCPEGDYCFGGRCELDDRAGCPVCEVCDSHSACGVGGYCAGLGRNSVSGICTRFCTSSAQCPGTSECVEWDSGRGQVQVCASSVRDDDGSLCAAGWQCEVPCREDLPCGAGEACVAGACEPGATSAGDSGAGNPAGEAVDEDEDEDESGTAAVAGCHTGQSTGGAGPALALGLLMFLRSCRRVTRGQRR